MEPQKKPDCCPKGKEHLRWTSTASKVAGWALGLAEDIGSYDWEYVAVSFCPFCGHQLDAEEPQVSQVDIEHHEYYCGSYCTENGCLGHESDIPIAFGFQKVWFEVSGYTEGEVPWDDPDGVKNLQEYKEVFDELTRRLNRG